MHNVASKNTYAEDSKKIVLVGTYKGDQLKNWRGWYCWPISDEDLAAKDAKNAKVGCDDPIAPYASVNELWLFNGTKDERRYRAAFVGIKTREELIRDYGYLAWERDGLAAKREECAPSRPQSSADLSTLQPFNSSTRPHGTHYALFKTQLLYRHKGDVPGDAERVIIRTADFATASVFLRSNGGNWLCS